MPSERHEDIGVSSWTSSSEEKRGSTETMGKQEALVLLVVDTEQAQDEDEAAEMEVVVVLAG